MGKLKETLAFEKENMPEYQYRFLYKRVMPGFFFVLGGAIVVLILGMILDLVAELTVLSFIPLALWGATTLVLLVLFVIYGKKTTARLIGDKAKAFEKEYALLDYGEAAETLAEKGMISEDRLIWEDGVLSLEDCSVYFNCRTVGGAYILALLFYRSDGELICAYPLDGALCTYFNRHKARIVNGKLFSLFLEEKAEFMRLLLRYNDPEKMEKHIKA